MVAPLTQYAERVRDLAAEVKFGPLPGPSGKREFDAQAEELRKLLSNPDQVYIYSLADSYLRVLAEARRQSEAISEATGMIADLTSAQYGLEQALSAARAGGPDAVMMWAKVDTYLAKINAVTGE